MTTSDAMTRVRNILLVRYPNYYDLDKNERVLLAAAVLADDIKVREEGENNHGEWIEAILGAVKLEEGYPWCAAMIEFCCDVAKVEQIGLSDRASAAVAEWHKWAEANGRITNDPKRGDLCLWLKAGGNHMGIVVTPGNYYMNSIEGNTSSGATGSQRDGGGCYRRSRLRSAWTHFIRI
jgi:hypothetical protein